VRSITQLGHPPGPPRQLNPTNFGTLDVPSHTNACSYACFKGIHSDIKSRQLKYLSILFISNYSGDRVKKDQDGRGMWHVWGKGEMHIGFWWGNVRDRNDFQDLQVDGRILKWISTNWGGQAWLIGLVRDSDTWRAVVNAATNFQVP
jgi:hypothetical protein